MKLKNQKFCQSNRTPSDQKRPYKSCNDQDSVVQIQARGLNQ